MLLGVGTLSPSALQTIAATITQVEGSNPAYASNNNPGDLLYVGQAGATKGSGGFAAFPTLEAGQNALYAQIQNYADRGLSIQDMMNIYAPASQPGNNPDLYAGYIAGALGVTPDTSLNALEGDGGDGGSWYADMTGGSPIAGGTLAFAGLIGLGLVLLLKA